MIARIRFAAALTLLCCAAVSYAQEDVEIELPGQYKRVHQQAYKDILNGKTDKAIGELNAMLTRLPKDAESHYMLAVAYCKTGDLESAIEHAKRAIELGLPPGRIVGGTLTGLAPLLETDYGKQLLAKHKNEPVHGPMVGSVTPGGFSVWIRTAGEADVRLVVSGNSSDSRSELVRTGKQTDYTAVLTVAGLAPETAYRYHVEINGKVEGQSEDGYEVHTAPPAGEPTKFRLVFGGGAGFVPPNERMWNTIGKERPDLLLILGDNVYIDDPTTPAMQHYTYYRRQSRPEFRKLIAQTPVYTIWDDHDFGTNDCSGGPEIESPPWKRRVWRVYKNNWVNPGYGGGEKHPGCWYDFYRGDVHFILLDGRYYRNHKPDDNGRPSMLGPVQRRWLLDTLKGSKGKLIVLCSPVPCVFNAKGKSKDTWNGFQEERNEIFDFLAENKIDGVVILSADRHRSDLWKIERDNGYPLYEFSSSRLTNQHVHPEMKAAVFSYNKKQSCGTVDIDTTLDDPTITYRIVNIDGKEIHKFTVRRSELTHK